MEEVRDILLQKLIKARIRSWNIFLKIVPAQPVYLMFHGFVPAKTGHIKLEHFFLLWAH